MLQQICETLHNYFIKNSYGGVFEIADGTISLPLLDGQRFLIRGSVLNDGVYTYHEGGYITDDDDKSAAGLRDETFTGSVCALAVPPAVIALTEEIKAWVDKYGEAVDSPYTSENVLGVYSYSKATGTNGKTVTWKDTFKERLNQWRRVCF